MAKTRKPTVIQPRGARQRPERPGAAQAAPTARADVQGPGGPKMNLANMTFGQQAYLCEKLGVTTIQELAALAEMRSPAFFVHAIVAATADWTRPLTYDEAARCTYDDIERYLYVPPELVERAKARLAAQQRQAAALAGVPGDTVVTPAGVEFPLASAPPEAAAS